MKEWIYKYNIENSCTVNILCKVWDFLQDFFDE